jgi:DNA-directed RNA polymerase subunit RPC12/RpoP
MLHTTHSPATKPNAWIVSSNDRGRKRIYTGNKVYLSDKQNFEIELENKTQFVYSVRILVNNQPISSSNLVIKPGSRSYLDCFVDSKKKFVFSTYDVENDTQTQLAIAKNGMVDIYFHREIIQTPIVTVSPSIWYGATPVCTTYTNSPSTIYGNSASRNPALRSLSCALDSMGDASSTVNLSSSIETGRVEQGEKSNQQFDSYFGSFEVQASHSVSYQILPESLKPIEVEKIAKSKYNFCPNCGHKLEGGEKFCPNCGHKLD